MKTNHDGVRPVVKWACLAMLLGVIAFLVFFSPRQQKPISSDVVTQAKVAAPAEETNNKGILTPETETVSYPAVPETVTMEVRMVRISRVAKPPTNSVQQQANQ